MSLALIVLVLAFLVLMVIGMPLSFAMGISAVAYFVLSDQSLFTLSHQLFTGLDVFVLMAIPLFILAGEVMTTSGITDRLLQFAEALVGRVPGGMAHTNVVASMLFAGCSGSALADVSGLGSVEIPMMNKAGYDPDFSTAVTAATSIQGPIIPPSIPLVIYGAVTSTSIGGLLIGGLVPGVLIAIADMVLIYFLSKRRNFPVRTEAIRLKELAVTLVRALPVLVMPAIIMGAILGGIATPTEAAALAVAYAFIVAGIGLRSLSGREIFRLLVRVGSMTSSILLLAGFANAFGWALSVEQAPQLLTNLVTSLTENPYLVLFLLNVALLIWGVFMDTMPAIILLGPILAPMTASLGIHPVHFGVVMVTNLMIGLITPPYGVCLFAASIVSGRPLDRIIKAIVPFLAVDIVVLFIITYFPKLVMFLPEIFNLAS